MYFYTHPTINTGHTLIANISHTSLMTSHAYKVTISTERDIIYDILGRIYSYTKTSSQVTTLT